MLCLDQGTVGNILGTFLYLKHFISDLEKKHREEKKAMGRNERGEINSTTSVRCVKFTIASSSDSTRKILKDCSNECAVIL